MPDVKTQLARLLFATGMLRFMQRTRPQTLTVLNYHRVDHFDGADFDTFKPNISATPPQFEQQMGLLAQWFNLISLNELIAFLNGSGTLPSHAALITFDDGYLDNYSYAQPIMAKYHFPAIIFLATEHIGQRRAFFWDLIAYCFYHTDRAQVDLPGLGVLQWAHPGQQECAIKKVTTWLKQFPEDEKQDWVSGFPAQMGVTLPRHKFEQLMMDWNQVRELRQKNIAFGGHTLTHPILTRISLDQARAEIEGAKKCIEAEISQPVTSFAYPNGQAGDFNAAIKHLVAETGYQTAFTLISGTNPLPSIQAAPFEIRRIFISHKDTLPRFAAKVSGI